MKPAQHHAHSPQDGFTLVELMVGLVIGLLATLVIMQVFSVFEAQKRTTTGSADAQTNGSIALYSIRSDVQIAGWGLHPFVNPQAAVTSPNTQVIGSVSPLRCNALFIEGVASNPPSQFLFPIVITDGGAGAGASDTITARYGNTMTAGIPMVINTLVGNVVTVNNNLSCRVNDAALIFDSSGANCARTTVTALSPPPVGNPASAPPATVTLDDVTNMVSSTPPPPLTPTNYSLLSCQGIWNERTYSVRANNLNLDRMVNGVDSVAGIVAAEDIIADIVNMQAQYGITATVNDNQVIQWVDATGTAPAGGTWAAPTPADQNRIRAIRIALVARNGLLEKTDVTDSCSSTTAASPTGLCAWDATSANPANPSPAPTIDLSNDPNWQKYRYRVFETIIPLRNMIWIRSTL